MDKAILFLDFDYTLFDTAQFYDWLGVDIEGRIALLVDRAIDAPNFADMLYPDTIEFLSHIEKTHRRVLLSYANNVPLQEMKVADSGIEAYLDDVIIVPGIRGEGGKAREAKAYLASHPSLGVPTLIDDAPENFAEVRAANLRMRSIRIDRRPPRAGGQIDDAQKPDAVVTNLAQVFELLRLPPRQP